MPTTAYRETRATTVRIPRPVYEQAKGFVCSDQAKASTFLSLNDFFATAIQAYVKLYRRRQIDAAFAGMAEDADYQKDVRLLAEQFEDSDWEALRLGDEILIGEESSLATASSAR
jgi:hypothetical protein